MRHIRFERYLTCLHKLHLVPCFILFLLAGASFAQSKKPPVDDSANPFDDQDSPQSTSDSIDTTKEILNANPFEAVGYESHEDPINGSSLDALDETLEGESGTKKIGVKKHEFNEKDIQKEFSTKPKKIKKKSASTPAVIDNVTEQRKESQKKALAHETEKKRRLSKSAALRELSLKSSSEDLISLKQEEGLEGTKALQSTSTGTELALTSGGALSEGKRSFRHDADAMPHAAQMNEDRLNAAPEASDPHFSTAQGSPAEEAGNFQNLRRTHSKSPYDPEDFDKVAHQEAGQDAYSLSEKSGTTYEPTLYREDEAVSILKGSPVAQSKKSSGSGFINRSGLLDDEAADPFQSQEPGLKEGPQDDPLLSGAGGLFGDPFVNSTLVNDLEDGDIEQEYLASPEMSYSGYESNIHAGGVKSSKASAQWSKNQSAKSKQKNSQNPLIHRVNTTSQAYHLNLAQAHEPHSLGSENTVSENTQLASEGKKKVLGSERQLAAKILEAKPEFVLNLNVRPNQKSLASLGMTYAPLKEQLVKNAVAQGSLQFGVLGVPLKSLPQDTLKSKGFGNRDTPENGHDVWWRYLNLWQLSGLAALLIVLFAGGAGYLKFTKAKATSP